LKSENIKINKTKIISAAGKILPAFGRGEKIKIESPHSNEYYKVVVVK